MKLNTTKPLIARIASGIGSTQAALLVYEGFDYGAASTSRAGADLLDGQPDGAGGDGTAFGLPGTWEDSTNVQSTDFFIRAPTQGKHKM